MRSLTVVFWRRAPAVLAGLATTALLGFVAFPQLVLDQEWDYMATMRGRYAGTWIVDPKFESRLAELGPGFDRLVLRAVECSEAPWSAAELEWNGRRICCTAEAGPFLRFGEWLSGPPLPETMDQQGIYVHAFRWEFDAAPLLFPLALPAILWWSWPTHDALFVEAQASAAGCGTLSNDPATSQWIRFVRTSD